MSRFLDAYKEQGLDFWGITVENEPSYPFPDLFRGVFYGWNGLGITPAEERDFVKLDLGPALVKAGYGPDKLSVMVYDHGPGGGLKLFDGAHTCFNDTQAAKYLRGKDISTDKLIYYYESNRYRIPLLWRWQRYMACS